jgi:alpha-ketoglutarate-dependent 2,4-dichlorophenoxyacetate dioxygenase
MVTVEEISPGFVAVVGGVDLSRPMPDDVFAEVDAAFERYAVLVFHDQPLTEDQQAAFALRFGPLEPLTAPFVVTAGNQRRLSRGEFSDISNLDENGRILAASDSRRLINKANQLWHTDSSFKRVPAKMSMLSAQSVVDTGGETEFADMRAAWDALPAERRERLEGLVAEHDYFRSRIQVGLDPGTISAERREQLPPVPQVLVRTLASGRKSLYLASHVKRIYGMDAVEGRRLVDELIEHATQPRFVHAHRWAVNDVVMWDNRCTMHRGRPWDETKVRAMRRATVTDVGPTVPQDWRSPAERATVEQA